jgi:hypothetical protein
MELQGWVKLHRKLLQTTWFKNPSAAHLAVYCILRAYWEPGKVLWGHEEKMLEPGQFRTGSKVLSAETGLTRSQLRTALKILSTTGFLTNQSTNLGTIITVVKYKDYQILEKTQPTLSPTLDQPLTTNEEVKKLRIKELKKDQKIAQRQKSPTVPVPQSEAIKIYREIFHLNPGRIQVPEIDKVVYTNRELENWQEACHAWAMAGNRPTNIQGILEWYKNGNRSNFKSNNKSKYDHNMDVAKQMIQKAREEKQNG